MGGDLAGSALAAPPDGETDEGDSAYDQQNGEGVVLDDADGFRAELDHEQRQDQPADETAGEYGEHEGDYAHLEDAGGEDKCFPWSGRGQGRGDGHGEELLLFEAEFHALVPLAVDALEDEELSTSAAECVGEQSADG